MTVQCDMALVDSCQKHYPHQIQQIQHICMHVHVGCLKFITFLCNLFLIFHFISSRIYVTNLSSLFAQRPRPPTFPSEKGTCHLRFLVDCLLAPKIHHSITKMVTKKKAQYRGYSSSCQTASHLASQPASQVESCVKISVALLRPRGNQTFHN